MVDFRLCFNKRFIASWVFVLLWAVGQAKADDSPLVFGMSTALTGPAADLGRGMKAGVEAAFSEYNNAGGYRGRSLQLVVLDDGYEPSRTAPNMRQLIEGQQVLAVVGNVGTPTAVVAIPIANETKTPLIGAFTGAGVLRKSPPDRYVVNLRASYAQETAAMVDALLAKGIRPEEIAFFTQYDAYGDAGYSEGVESLERAQPGVGAKVAHGRYQRNTLAVEGGLADLLVHEPEPRAVIMVGAYAPCARFIQLARQADFNPYFLNVSFVGAESLARDLGPYGEGVIITQVMPHADDQVPFTKQARSALAAEVTRMTPVTVEGYAVGRLVIAGLEQVEGPATRESLIDGLESLGKFDLGMGTDLCLTRDRHQASDSVWPNSIRNGQVKATTWQDAIIEPQPGQ